MAAFALGVALASCDGGTAALNSPGPMVMDPLPADAPAVATAAPVLTAACPIALSEVALYQAVKVPLAGVASGASAVDVVRRRPALVRAFARVAGPVDARLRLTVSTGSSTRSFEEARRLEADSSDRDLESTFNFDLDAAAMDGDLSWSVEVLEPAACAGVAGARLPATGRGALRTRRTGVLRVRLVPIRYDGDGSGRMPDISEPQLERYRAMLRATYPVEEVDLSVRDAVNTELKLGGGDGAWSELLEAVRALRGQDRPGEDVYYYGIVSPGGTFTTYCQRACIAGLAYQAVAGRGGLRVGVGVGFAGAVAADTLAHELGHSHGRGHSPCGTKAGVDAAFPHDGGAVGVWGFDARTRSIVAPNRLDLMGYCSPRWISDFTWQALVERNAGVNVVAQPLRIAGEGRRYRSLLVDGQGRARWGVPVLESEPVGVAERAVVTDARGAAIEEVDVYRTPIADGAGSLLLVPAGRPGWHRVAIAGSLPIGFADAPGVTGFTH